MNEYILVCVITGWTLWSVVSYCKFSGIQPALSGFTSCLRDIHPEAVSYNSSRDGNGWFLISRLKFLGKDTQEHARMPKNLPATFFDKILGIVRQAIQVTGGLSLWGSVSASLVMYSDRR